MIAKLNSSFVKFDRKTFIFPNIGATLVSVDDSVHSQFLLAENTELYARARARTQTKKQNLFKLVQRR
jgi:hypothetical protein